MDKLPDEIILECLDYLEPRELATTQRVASRYLQLARGNRLWRDKCFEKSAKVLTPAIRSKNAVSSAPGLVYAAEPRFRISKRAQAVADWDPAHADEDVNWYSEYVGRHAALSVDWLDANQAFSKDIRGIATVGKTDKVVGPLEDGSFCLWDISVSRSGRRHLQERWKSKAGALFEDRTKSEGCSAPKTTPTFSGMTESVTVDATTSKAYFALNNILNEVDLNTMQVSLQHKYAWPITAFSREGDVNQPITIGTTWSLHLYDPRIATTRDRSCSPEDHLRMNPAPEESIAFLPNYAKGFQSPAPVQPLYHNPYANASNPTSLAVRRSRPYHLSNYAAVEPGPLSILHQGKDDILIAGRFPSILSYDRRFFPRLQYVIHSGARLSALTSIPYPPRGATPGSGAESTLVACGEYGGRGSLELYSLPHVRQESGGRRSGDCGLGETAEHLGAMDRESAYSRAVSEPDYPFSYKNRHTASSSKLLYVAVHGMRIVFSDAEGGLKWVERDGAGLVRRWNINAFEVDERGTYAGITGDSVVRKIVPLPPTSSSYVQEEEERHSGTRGDADLLIWTGEKIGIVTTKPSDFSPVDDELAATFGRTGFDATDDQDEGQGDEDRVDEYRKVMRRALERQAAEVNWMGRFGLRG